MSASELDDLDAELVIWAREIPDLDPLTEGIVERIHILAHDFNESMSADPGRVRPRSAGVQAARPVAQRWPALSALGRDAGQRPAAFDRSDDQPARSPRGGRAGAPAARSERPAGHPRGADRGRPCRLGSDRRDPGAPRGDDRVGPEHPRARAAPSPAASPDARLSHKGHARKSAATTDAATPPCRDRRPTGTDDRGHPRSMRSNVRVSRTRSSAPSERTARRRARPSRGSSSVPSCARSSSGAAMTTTSSSWSPAGAASTGRRFAPSSASSACRCPTPRRPGRRPATSAVRSRRSVGACLAGLVDASRSGPGAGRHRWRRTRGQYPPGPGRYDRGARRRSRRRDGAGRRLDRPQRPPLRLITLPSRHRAWPRPGRAQGLRPRSRRLPMPDIGPKRIAEFIAPFRVEPGRKGQAAKGLRPRRVAAGQHQGGETGPPPGRRAPREYQMVRRIWPRSRTT